MHFVSQASLRSV